MFEWRDICENDDNRTLNLFDSIPNRSAPPFINVFSDLERQRTSACKFGNIGDCLVCFSTCKPIVCDPMPMFCQA